MNAVREAQPTGIMPPGVHAGPLWRQPGLRELMDPALPIRERLPALDDDARWSELDIGGQRYLCAHPITFTPYASWQACSARCQFCSENLRLPDDGPAAAGLRPGPYYFEGLRGTLERLRGLPLSWSVSGLEATDDIDALCQLLAVLSDAERAGQVVEERVLYSNAAGFAGSHSARLIATLQAFGLTRLECSRHHHEAARNQSIMRFRPEHLRLIEQGDVVLRGVAAALPTKLVCVVQRGGIETAGAVDDYLDWAQALGAQGVIFRELARLDADYLPNRTARYIHAARIDVGSLAADALRGSRHRLEAVEGTRGYYFSNLCCRGANGLEVVFEAADYAHMHARHDSERVYKLIHFANGELAADWQPGRRTLWHSGRGD